MKIGVSQTFWIRVWSVLLLVGGIATAALTLYSVFCVYTNLGFGYFDYGLYTQALWNCGHGGGFHVYVDRSYLMSHLSFSLAPLGLLFRIWDHPLLLVWVQWAAYSLGGAILYRIARRHGLAPSVSAALLFFYFGYAFSQAAVFSQFHGVTLLLGLLPWLYYCLCFSRRWVWLPLLCILGLREDGFFCVLPLLLYFGFRKEDPWRPARYGAVLAVLYGVLALTVLFPWLSGQSVWTRREGEIPQDLEIVSRLADVGERGPALLCAALPLLAVAGRRMWPALLLPAAAFLQANLSLVEGQFLMRRHYGVAFAATLACGLVETLAWRRRHTDEGLGRSFLRSGALVAVTLTAHFLAGYLPGGPHWKISYSGFSSDGLTLMELQKKIPKQTMLATADRLSPFCANRRDILIWDNAGWASLFDEYTNRVDWVLLDVKQITDEVLGRKVLDWCANGSFGVVAYEGNYALLNRSAPTGMNSRLLQDAVAADFRVAIPHTLSYGGRNLMRAGRLWRYWEGNGRKAPVTLSYEEYRTLEPGRHQVCFLYAVATPRQTIRGDWGSFSVHRYGESNAIAEVSVAPVPVPCGAPQIKRLSFALDQRAKVELRVTGGEARLWIAEGWFEPLP